MYSWDLMYFKKENQKFPHRGVNLNGGFTGNFYRYKIQITVTVKSNFL